MTNEQSFEAIDERTFIQRCINRMFPYRPHEGRLKFMEDGSGYGFTTVNHIHLNWLDRVRVLVGGVIVLEVSSNTEQNPGKAESISFVNIHPPGKVQP